MPEPIELESVNHISVESADVERGAAFYREVLGLRAVWRPDFGFRGYWLEHGPVQIHLIEGTPPARSDEISTRGDHVAFRVADVALAERRLAEHGVPFRRNVQPTTGTVQLFFHDPDGTTIELASHPPTRQQPGEG